MPAKRGTPPLLRHHNLGCKEISVLRLIFRNFKSFGDLVDPVKDVGHERSQFHAFRRHEVTDITQVFGRDIAVSEILNASLIDRTGIYGDAG